MEPEQNTQTPMQENAFPPAVEGNNKNVFMIGGVAVIVILAGLGWYMMKSINMPTAEVAPVVATPETTQTTEQNPATSTTDQTATGTQDAATAALSTQGTSDDLNSIDADLKATDLNSLNDINKI